MVRTGRASSARRRSGPLSKWVYACRRRAIATPLKRAGAWEHKFIVERLCWARNAAPAQTGPIGRTGSQVGCGCVCARSLLLTSVNIRVSGQNDGCCGAVVVERVCLGKADKRERQVLVADVAGKAEQPHPTIRACQRSNLQRCCADGIEVGDTGRLPGTGFGSCFEAETS